MAMCGLVPNYSDGLVGDSHPASIEIRKTVSNKIAKMSIPEIGKYRASAHKTVKGAGDEGEELIEITAIPPLPDLIEVKGGIVTMDAMGRRYAIAGRTRVITKCVMEEKER